VLTDLEFFGMKPSGLADSPVSFNITSFSTRGTCESIASPELSLEFPLHHLLLATTP
jgi:hypothetical protein